MRHGGGWPGVSVSPDGPSPVVSLQVCGRLLRLFCSRTFWCVLLWLSGGVRFCFAFSFPLTFAVDLSSQCVLKYCCKRIVIFFCLKEGNFFFSVIFLFFLCFCLWLVSVRILLRTCVIGDPAHLPAVFLFIAALFRRCRDGAKRWSEGVCWILGICLWGFYLLFTACPALFNMLQTSLRVRYMLWNAGASSDDCAECGFQRICRNPKRLQGVRVWKS